MGQQYNTDKALIINIIEAFSFILAGTWLAQFNKIYNLHKYLVGLQKQTIKALIHNNIKAFLFVTTETILKHF